MALARMLVLSLGAADACVSDADDLEVDVDGPFNAIILSTDAADARVTDDVDVDRSINATILSMHRIMWHSAHCFITARARYCYRISSVCPSVCP